jgi:hypothetical protein
MTKHETHHNQDRGFSKPAPFDKDRKEPMKALESVVSEQQAIDDSQEAFRTIESSMGHLLSIKGGHHNGRVFNGVVVLHFKLLTIKKQFDELFDIAIE